jgi:hypothetical protein
VSAGDGGLAPCCIVGHLEPKGMTRCSVRRTPETHSRGCHQGASDRTRRRCTCRPRVGPSSSSGSVGVQFVLSCRGKTSGLQRCGASAKVSTRGALVHGVSRPRPPQSVLTRSFPHLIRHCEPEHFSSPVQWKSRILASSASMTIFGRRWEDM